MKKVLRFFVAIQGGELKDNVWKMEFINIG